MTRFMNNVAPVHTSSNPSSLRVVTLLLGVSFLAVYYAYQKKMLPRHIARVVGRVLFYPTLTFTFIRRIGNFWSHIDGTTLIGVAPFAALGHVKALHAEGVRGVVNLCDEYGGPTEEYSSMGMTQLYLPTDDHYEPSFADLQKAVAYIDQHAKRNEKVYVHCKSGHGRSAAVVLCWLLHHNAAKGMTPVEGNQLMLSKRSVRRKLFTQPNILRYYNEIVKPSATSSSK